MLPFPQPSLNTKSWFAIIDRLCSGEQAGIGRRAQLGVERIEDRITQEDIENSARRAIRARHYSPAQRVAKDATILDGLSAIQKLSRGRHFGT